MTHRWRTASAVAGLLAVGAAVRVVFLRYPYVDSDQAVIGLMGIHILEGQFPIYFWGEPYSGTLESFLASLLFYSFGVSRLTLNLSPFIFSLVFLYLTWRLGRAAFGTAAGYFSLALVAVGPTFLIWHSVLARGNYIENLVLGNTLFLMVLTLVRRDLPDPVFRRRLLIFGFVAGLAWYMNFQSVHYLIVSGLCLLWAGDLRRLARWSWLALGGAVVGSLPFWLFNLSSNFSSFGAISWYGRSAPAGTALPLFFRVKLPELLGASGFTYNYEPVHTRQIAFLFWVILGLYALAYLFVLFRVVSRRGWVSGPGNLGAGMLLLLPLVTGAVTVFGGFGGGADPRYFLPVYTAAPVLMGALLAGVMVRLRPAAVLALGVILLSNLYGQATTAQALPRYGQYLEHEQRLFAFMRERGIRYAYVPDYWFSYRFTFDARESIIFATPFWRDFPRSLSKYPPYTRVVDAEAKPAYVLWNARPFVDALQAAGVRYQREVLGRYTLLFDFQQVPYGPSIRPVGWRVLGSGEGEGSSVFDRDLTTAWSASPGNPLAPLTVDLGREYQISQVSVHLGLAAVNKVTALAVQASSDAASWTTAGSVLHALPGFSWAGDKLLLEEHGRVALAFPPVRARYLRVVPAAKPGTAAWSVAEIFVYEAGRGGEKPPADFWEALTLEQNRRGSEALPRYLEMEEEEPELEEAHIRTFMVARDLGIEPTWQAIYDYVAKYLLDRGDLVAAISYLERLVEMAPYRTAYQQRLLEAYEKTGELDAARQLRSKIEADFAPAFKAAVQFGRSIRLVGYTVAPPIVRPGETFRITYVWEALRPVGGDYTIFVHFNYGKSTFLNDHLPVDGRYPTSRWQPGERIRESYEVGVPPGAAPGLYTIRLGYWEPDRGSRLRIWRGWIPTTRTAAQVGSLEVVSAAARLTPQAGGPPQQEQIYTP